MNQSCTDNNIINGKQVNTNVFSSSMKDISESVYDVFRVKSGCPIFLDKHIDRLLSSAKILGKEINTSKAEIFEQIQKLIDINTQTEGNIKLTYDLINKDYYITYIEHKYPTEDDYKTGIKTKLFFGSRENAKAKSLNKEFKQKTINFIEKNKIHEAILVDKNNNICEGSRSNIFFIKDNILYTPKTDKILSGISRQNIISICKNNNIEIQEINININTIETYQSAFISGTSPLILGIREINTSKFNTSNDLLVSLRKKYIELIYEDIEKYKKLHNKD